MGKPLKKTHHQEGRGRPRETREHEDRVMVRSVLTTPDSSLSPIQHVTETAITTRTTDRRLREQGLKLRYPLLRLSLNYAHRQTGFQWCLARSTKSLTDRYRGVPISNRVPMTSEDVSQIVQGSGGYAPDYCPTGKQSSVIVWGMLFCLIAGLLCLFQLWHDGTSLIFYAPLCCSSFHSVPGWNSSRIIPSLTLQ